MLTPEYLMHAPEGAEAIAEDLHIDILQRLIYRIMLRLSRGDGYLLTAQDKYQIETLEQLGYLNQDIQKALAKATGRMQTEIAEAMEAAGVRVLQYDDNLYRAAGLNPTPIRQSPYIVRTMQAAYEQAMGEWGNATATTAEAVQRMFISACDGAYYRVLSGAMSASQAVKEAIGETISSGVTVTYPSGQKDTIETATARAVRTGISQGAARVQLARMDEMGIDLVLVSSHLGARPEHALWQGKVYSRGGEYRGQYPDFVESTGYGTVTGLCGANCRHSFSAWFPGMENPWTQYDTEENRQEYEKEQRQRAMERKIRKTKREVMGYREAMEDAKDESLRDELATDYKKKALRLQHQNAAYNEYCKDNGLKKQSDRISIAQWDRKQAAQATAAARKYGANSSEQNYKPVNRDKPAEFIANSGERISAKSIAGYNNVYVSDNATIKPKALHEINKNTNDALVKWGVPPEKSPKIVVLDNSEMPTALGKYDAVTNTVYYTPDIANKTIMAENGGLGAVEYHEMWHLRQADDFRNAGWKITKGNFPEYIGELCKKAKRRLDSMGITSYNVGEVSRYAEQKYLIGRYDEAEAEIMAKRREL